MCIIDLVLMTSSEMCPSHVTLTSTLSVQGHTVFYVYICIYVCSHWIFSNYVAALQSGHSINICYYF